MAFQRRQARAQFHVPDLEGLVPGCRHDGLTVGRKNARRNRITVIFEMSGNTFVRSSTPLPPLNLRLSPGDRGQHATLRKKQPPVALERLQALA